MDDKKIPSEQNDVQSRLLAAIKELIDYEHGLGITDYGPSISNNIVEEDPED